jgi:hypothetical protein
MGGRSKPDMKRDLKELAGQFRGNGVAIVAVILLLFPCSASVLCIAPGGHVAIEDSNAACCASPGNSAPAGRHSDNEFNGAGDCHNCTDLFMTPNGRGAVLESYDNAAASLRAAECPGNHIPAETPSSPRGSATIKNLDAPIAITSSVPLRC